MVWQRWPLLAESAFGFSCQNWSHFFMYHTRCGLFYQSSKLLFHCVNVNHRKNRPKKFLKKQIIISQKKRNRSTKTYNKSIPNELSGHEVITNVTPLQLLCWNIIQLKAIVCHGGTTTSFQEPDKIQNL